MKKVLIGVLILIPVLILVVVALVTSMLQLQAWIAVEDISVTLKGTDTVVSQLDLNLNVASGQDTEEVFDLNDWLDIAVYPEKANRYTVEWAFTDLQINDPMYNQESAAHPAATLIDSDGEDVESNTSGKFKLYAYCSFDVSVSAETVNKTFSVTIVGDKVTSVLLANASGETQSSLTVGQSERLSALFVPLNSKVEELKFEVVESSADDIVSVDENGVITALGEGSATLRALASKYEEDSEGQEKEFVASNDFTVTVSAGASKYGDKVTMASVPGGKYTFEQLGIEAQDVMDGENYTVQDDGIVINGEGAEIALKDGKSLEVAICNEGDIVIKNAEFFENKQDGFVLDIGGRGLTLGAAYAATAAEGAPTVVWSSSQEEVAAVDANGVVIGLSNGTTTITATAGEKSASVEISVHSKIASIRLRTSDASFKAGLARETVFASYKYKGGDDETHQYDMLTNSVLVHLHNNIDDDDNAALKAFYADYTFEIEEGKKYAHFDAETSNLLVFDADALKGQGVVPIKVKVYANYPLFDNYKEYTTAYVTIKAVYGVEVSTFEQALHASDDQREVAYGNKKELEFELKDSLSVPDSDKIYKVAETEHPQGNLAITLACDIKAPEGLIFEYHDKTRCITLYGNFYGNGHMIASMPENILDGASYTMRISCSDVTVSNVTIRHEDIQVDKLDGKTFPQGYCLITYSENDDGERLTNVNIEYSVFENSHCGVEYDNTDGVIKGCLFRNICSVGIYHFGRVYQKDFEPENEFRLSFSRIELNNCVFSSILAVSVSTHTANFALDNGNGRFSGSGNVEESYKWVEENLMPKRYVPCIMQTGFMDIYNWQNATDANLIDTGTQSYNELIRLNVQPMFDHPDFLPGVYTIEKDGIKTDYFHVGLLTSAISFPRANERTFAQITFEDERFFSIRFTEVKGDYPGITPEIEAAVRKVHLFEVTLYCYKKEFFIDPSTSYVVNNAFIEHLHEGNTQTAQI